MTPTDTTTPIGRYASADQADQIDQQFQQVADTNRQANDFAAQVNQHIIDQGAQLEQFKQMVADHVQGLGDQYQNFVGQVQGHVDSPAGQATTAAVRAGADPSNLARMRTLMSEKDYKNLCEQLVENSEGTTGKYPTAAAAAEAQKASLRTDFENAQPGDNVYYGGAPENGGSGHAALYAGNGTVLSSASKDPTPLNGYFRAPLLGYVPQNQPSQQQAPDTMAEQTGGGLQDYLDQAAPMPPVQGQPAGDNGPSPSDQQTSIGQYNEAAPGGLDAFRQVTKMASGDYRAEPTAQPSDEQQATYNAQQDATQGFTTPDVGAPLLAGSAPGAQTAEPVPPTPVSGSAPQASQPPSSAGQDQLAAQPPRPDSSQTADALRSASQAYLANPTPENQAAYQAASQADNVARGLNPDGSGAPPTPAVAPQPTDIQGMLADALHKVADTIGGRAQAAVQGAEQAANQNVGTDLTGNQGFGDLVTKAGDIVSGGVAGVLGAKGSEPLPPDTVAPGKLADPYTNTGLADVPVVGGAVRAALNPFSYTPGLGEARAADVAATAVKDVAESAAEFGASQAGKGMPAMAGAAVSTSSPSLLGRVADAVAGKELAPDEMANRVANAIQQQFSSPNLAGVKNIRGAITMNAGAKASWDLGGDLLGTAVEQALPDAAERARIVTEFNDPTARATWTPDMKYWADYWTKAERNTSQIAKDTGVIQNMLPDYMARLARKPDGSPVEASAFSDYVGASKQRSLPSYQDFADAIAAKGFEPVTDLADVMRAKISSLGNAIENSRLGTSLESMPASDGNPILLPQKAIGRTFGKGGEEGNIILGNQGKPGYQTVHIPGMGDRLVNSTALADLKDVIKPPIDNPVYQALTRFNRGIQWGIMYNPMVHARNVLTPAMAGSGGWDALAAGIPVWRQGMDVVRSNPEDLLEFVRGGLSLTANREARQAAVDALVAQSPDTGVGALASKIPMREGLDTMLWDGIVQPLQLGTAQRLRDQFLKKGMSREDAVKAASEAANTMFGQLPSSTLSSVQRQAGSLLLFAKNWTFGNLRVLRYASYDLPGHGLAERIGLDKPVAAMGNVTRNVSPVAGQLTPEAEGAVADTARKYLVRAFAQGAVSHAALNIALTGHDQFGNAPGHETDLGWKDTQGAEHYSSYPFYKQAQDYMGHAGVFGKSPVRTVTNRVAPAISTAFEAGEPFMAPRDAGADGPVLHALKVGIHNLAPFGVGNLVNTNTRSAPEQPLALDVLGANAKADSAASGGSGKPTAPHTASGPHR